MAALLVLNLKRRWWLVDLPKTVSVHATLTLHQESWRITRPYLLSEQQEGSSSDIIQARQQRMSSTFMMMWDNFCYLFSQMMCVYLAKYIGPRCKISLLFLL